MKDHGVYLSAPEVKFTDWLGKLAPVVTQGGTGKMYSAAVQPSIMQLHWGHEEAQILRKLMCQLEKCLARSLMQDYLVSTVEYLDYNITVRCVRFHENE